MIARAASLAAAAIAGALGGAFIAELGRIDDEKDLMESLDRLVDARLRKHDKDTARLLLTRQNLATGAQDGPLENPSVTLAARIDEVSVQGVGQLRRDVCAVAEHLMPWENTPAWRQALRDLGARDRADQYAAAAATAEDIAGKIADDKRVARGEP